MSEYTIHNEDCLLVLASMPDESIDSIVTDPPYLISFMGKDWDSADGIAGQPDVWRECLRVLKPGGHLLAFGATRTYHRMTVAIEDAGFEIRDSIHWTYGSGFPKSLDVSKAIDKMTGAEGEVVGKRRFGKTSTGQASGWNANAVAATGEQEVRAPATTEAQQWQGWGTALKPSHEPIVVARKPLAGTVAQTVLAYGTGALNIDGTRVGNETVGWGGAPGFSNMTETQTTLVKGGDARPVSGRWPANTILTHSAGCQKTGETSDTMTGGFGNGGIGMSEIGAEEQSAGKGAEWQERSTTVALYACEQGCPVAEMDKQSGTLSQGHWAKTKVTGYGKNYGGTTDYKGTGEKATDKGGASRFFTQCEWDAELDAPFLYVAKPAKRERDAGLDAMPEQQIVQFQTGNGASGKPSSISEGRDTKRRNTHPTVKPVALMRHLCRLVTPPNGTVLDPFTGSGTTGVAAILEGFHFVGIEMTEEYLPIIEGRLQHAEQTVRENKEKETPTLFDEDNAT